MPPRRNRNKHVLCTCVSHECATKRYMIDGIWQTGNLVIAKTARHHQLDDQAQASDLAPAAGPTTSASLHSPEPESEGEAPQPEEREGEAPDHLFDAALAAVTKSLTLTRIGPARPSVFDTSRWMVSPVLLTAPVFTYGALIATMFSILQSTSNRSSAWILRSQRDMIELTLCNGLRSQSSPRSLTATEQSTLDELPVDTRTTIKWLKLDPSIQRQSCCARCFATYPLNRTPDHCYHQEDHVDEEEPDDKDAPANEESPDPQDGRPCGEPMFRLRRSVKTPVRYFAFQSLRHWIALITSSIYVTA
ncbi:hypothetical protein MJO29_000026 [Puccinia striiformis f. sp. tritici]|nr:hypothetical protein MJO29_000026 [Puccinia striiformis f. sp. tritici]